MAKKPLSIGALWHGNRDLFWGCLSVRRREGSFVAAMVRSISIVPLLGVFLLLFGSGPVRADEKAPKEKNVLIIGRSSLRPPLAQHWWEPCSRATRRR